MDRCKGLARTTRRALLSAAPAVALVAAAPALAAASENNLIGKWRDFLDGCGLLRRHTNMPSTVAFAAELGLDPDDITCVELSHRWEPKGSMPKLYFTTGEGKRFVVGPDGYHDNYTGITHARVVD